MKAKKKYNIPKSFKMGGQEIRVEVVPSIGIPGAVGVCHFNRNLIRVQTHQDGVEMAVTQVEQIFWHEYSHLLLDHCRFEDLSMNEHLVDLMGEFLTQSLGSKVVW